MPKFFGPVFPHYLASPVLCPKQLKPRNNPVPGEKAVARRIPGDNGFEWLASQVLKVVVVSLTGVIGSSGIELNNPRGRAGFTGR